MKKRAKARSQKTRNWRPVSTYRQLQQGQQKTDLVRSFPTIQSLAGIPQGIINVKRKKETVLLWIKDARSLWKERLKTLTPCPPYQSLHIWLQTLACRGLCHNYWKESQWSWILWRRREGDGGRRCGWEANKLMISSKSFECHMGLVAPCRACRGLFYIWK